MERNEDQSRQGKKAFAAGLHSLSAEENQMLG
jgi:hypothetical protein